MSRTKSSDIKLIRSIIWQLESGLPWYLTARYDSFRSHYVFQLALLEEELNFLQNCMENTSRAETINKQGKLTYQYHRKGMCTSAPISSPSLWRQEATSSAIPHRLNNSSRSTSLLHIKKQCDAWVFEWAVERKQPVSCQGEHPEIISIIYHTDILQRGVRQGTISAWRLHLKGEKSRLARRGAASWFPRLVQTVQGK